MNLAASEGGREKMSQWFDIWDVRDFSNREGLQAEGLKDSVTRIRKIIHDEAKALGEEGYERIVLAGISQGGAVSVHTLLNLELPPGRHLGALLGFSCRMLFSGRGLGETRGVLGLEDTPGFVLFSYLCWGVKGAGPRALLLCFANC